MWNGVLSIRSFPPITSAICSDKFGIISDLTSETRIRAYETTIVPREFGRHRHSVLFHPDYDRRLRSLTESADPFGWPPKGRSRAQASNANTAGGDFHPAPRTCLAHRRGSTNCRTSEGACRRRRKGPATDLDQTSPDPPRIESGSLLRP